VGNAVARAQLERDARLAGGVAVSERGGLINTATPQALTTVSATAPTSRGQRLACMFVLLASRLLYRSQLFLGYAAIVAAQRSALRQRHARRMNRKIGPAEI
jgi:hypothetical protein